MARELPINHFYHYTAVSHYGLIIADGKLKTTESNIGSPDPSMPPFGVHVGPDVVWLTDVEVRGNGHEQGLNSARQGVPDDYKLAVRITVAVDDAQWWPDFADEHGINPRWRKGLEKGRDPESWFVVAREITEAEFVGVEFTADVKQS